MTEDFRLARYGTAFSTRPRAAEIVEEVRGKRRQETPVALDFTGVLSISYSFADELVGRLAAPSSGQALPHIHFVRARSDVARVLERALANREIDSHLVFRTPACV